MWGNALGWFLSVVLLTFLLLGMYTLNALGRVSGPSEFGIEQAKLGKLQLPTPPESMMETRDGVDASALYRAAIAEYRAKQEDYERFASSRNAGDITKLPALKNLLDAAPARTAAIFADDPRKIVTYRNKPELSALVALGHLAARAALLKQADSPDAAVKYFDAEFALGARLYEERLTVEEFTNGIELMSEASAGLIRVLPKSMSPQRGSAFRGFEDSRKQYYNDRILPVLKVLQSIDANVIGDHAGDIMYLARHAPERMLRVEAVFAMGRMRFFVGENGRIGNQRGAARDLKLFADDPDPIIRLAATEARDMTIEQYRSLK